MHGYQINLDINIDNGNQPHNNHEQININQL